MKKLFILFILFFTVLSAGELTWEKDLSTAFKLAKKEHKIVMVMVESKHCRWCKKMKHRTLSDDVVSKRLEKYVLVKVLQEDTDTSKYLPPIKGAPTIFFLTEDKKEIMTALGYYDVSDFTSYLNDMDKRVK